MRGPYPGESRVGVIRFVEGGASRRSSRTVPRQCQFRDQVGYSAFAGTELPSQRPRGVGDISDMQAMNHYDRDALVADDSSRVPWMIRIAFATRRGPALQRRRASAVPAFPRLFDLKVGADRLHSRVRNLVFGPEEPFEKQVG
jgi:hypothetical protein